jgi:hypothetical protein
MLYLFQHHSEMDLLEAGTLHHVQHLFVEHWKDHPMKAASGISQHRATENVGTTRLRPRTGNPEI